MKLDEALKLPHDTLAEIAVCADRVRTLQRIYFQTRGRRELEESKHAERELDKLLATTPASGQGQLFGAGPREGMGR